MSVKPQNALIPKVIPPNIPHGDMPGDDIQIFEDAIQKTNHIFPEIFAWISLHRDEKTVLSVCGGSGVGKTVISSLLAYYLNENGIGTYILSGDNYPRRIPKYNDAERLWEFRSHGVQGMIQAGCYQRQAAEELLQLQKKDLDADPANIQKYPWFQAYYETGKSALREYLGTPKEIDFDELNAIIRQFRAGTDTIWLKRMGRDETALWYDAVDFSKKQVLIVEWTHGNSDYLEGIDYPILLNSTPLETLAHRLARNRDGHADSPFVSLVLQLEQEKLHQQAKKAKLILSKDNRLLSFAEYTKMMEECGNGQ